MRVGSGTVSVESGPGGVGGLTTSTEQRKVIWKVSCFHNLYESNLY